MFFKLTSEFLTSHKKLKEKRRFLFSFSLSVRNITEIMQYPRDFVAIKIFRVRIRRGALGLLFLQAESSAKRDGFDLILVNPDAPASARARAPSTLIPG